MSVLPRCTCPDLEVDPKCPQHGQLVNPHLERASCDQHYACTGPPHHKGLVGLPPQAGTYQVSLRMCSRCGGREDEQTREIEHKPGCDLDPAAHAKEEAVDHPAHYGGKDNPYEAIKVIESWGLDFCLGNAVKYISRAGKKGDRLEDLSKAAWYLNRAIENLKKEKSK